MTGTGGKARAVKTQARVVVIGGGVTGCSVLYHLTKKGWSDVVLCERTELTAGSTWHSAGHVILYTLNECISRLNQYGVELYKRLHEETGQDPGFHVCGNMRIATHADRLDEFKRYLSVAETAGVAARLLGPGEVKELWPLMQTDGVVAAVYNPDDGHIAPADLTQALATGARQGGAKIHRETEVTGLERQAGGEWLVRTDKGDIRCQHVVSCTGNYAWQTLGMVGLAAQSVPVKHQFIVTEPIPELTERKAARLPEMPVMRDPEQSFYVRQEGDGLAMGCYEGHGEAVFVDGVPASFGQDLFPDELDKLLPYLEVAIGRVPALEAAGIKDVVNGPMPYTPDDMPTAGPAFGHRNLWLGEGNPFGITLAGGIGWQLAEWIVEGEPSIDMWPCDSRRYGEFATRRYSALKTEEAYEHTYLPPKPEEELPAARPLKTTPIHDLLAAEGAVFGAAYGWERPNWFAPEGVEAKDECSFQRPNYFEHVGRECRQARATAGIADVSHGADFEVSGPGAADMLDRLLCTALPATGTAVSGYVLSEMGTVRSEFAVLREASGDFRLSAAASAERYDFDLLVKAAPENGSVRVDNLTGREGCLLLFGPAADDILAGVTGTDLSRAAAPGSTLSPTLGLAPVRIVRAGFAGESGWRIQTPVEYLRHVFQTLWPAGREAGACLIGARAMNGLRLEVGSAAWGSDLTRAFTALEAGLAPAIAFDKKAFRGRDAVLDQHQRGVKRRLVRLAISGNDSFDAIGMEPVRIKSGGNVGRTTSGGHGHCSGQSLAMAYVSSRAAADGDALEVKLMNEWYPAEVLPGPDRN